MANHGVIHISQRTRRTERKDIHITLVVTWGKQKKNAGKGPAVVPNTSTVTAVGSEIDFFF